MGGTHTSRLAILLLALTLVGCAGTTATPEAVVPTAAPTPTPEPTPTPRPTLTPDDLKIKEIIKDGVAETIERVTVVTENISLTEMVDAFVGLRDFASLEQTKIEIYEPSVCTERAVDLYRDAMSGIEEGSMAFLEYVASGGTGPEPDTSVMGEAGENASAALTAVQAACK